MSAIFFALCLLTFGEETYAANKADLKIGYVDVAQVFDSYNKTKDKDGELSVKTEGAQKQHEKMVEKIKNMKNELELLKEDKREEKQGQIDEEIKNLQAFDRDTREKLRKERDDMVRDILKEIDSIIKDYADSKGYTMILNRRVLIYGQEKDDISQEILEIINSRYKK